MRCAPFFLGAMVGEPSEALAKDGGEGGIRTPGRGFGPYNGLANRRLQPLGHLSAALPAGLPPTFVEYSTKELKPRRANDQGGAKNTDQRPIAASKQLTT